MQNEVVYINHWKNNVANAKGWADNTNLNDQDFEILASDIFAKTGVLLSVTTLKRIWGKVKYQSTPSAVTLNGLAKYIGYENWRAFKNKVDATLLPSGPTTTATPRRYTWTIPLIILVIAVIGTIAMRRLTQSDNSAKISGRPVNFSSRKVTDGLPNSVIFDYNATGLSTDSITLQQTWDRSRTERLSVNQTQHTSIYYYPGYFWAKLIANGKVLKEIPVSITSKDWLGIIAREPIPVYLSNTDIHLPGGLGVSSKLLAQKIGSPVFNGQSVGFYNVKDFNKLNGGNFKLDVTLQNTSTRQESSCRKVRIDILGKRNAILIPLAEKGCVSDLDLFTSSDWLIGKNRDMSAFGCDFNKPQHIICTVRDMVLKVYINNHLALNVPITQTISEIAGVCINFEGSGIISKISLGDERQTVLNDEFIK
jgi:hypothetical protein